MITRFKNVVANVMGGAASIPHPTERGIDFELQPKFAYTRPEFLELTDDDTKVSADHNTRPILCPRNYNILPWFSGYAEAINSGKSTQNEDQAVAGCFLLHKDNSSQEEKASMWKNHLNPFSSNKPEELVDFSCFEVEEDVSFTYFAVFDGHAGTGASIMAKNTLHIHIQDKLSAVKNLILSKTSDKKENGCGPSLPYKEIDKDSLVIGALEAAFCEMDEQIARERTTYKITGGTTALVAIFFLGKIYVANAGDCRAVILHGDEVTVMSTDFTPETERQRLQYLAYLQPELLQNDFTHLEFPRRISRKDLGKKMLHRDAQMVGWSSKTIMEDDLKFPLIYGEGKRTRVLATIGVTRGFGDHDLMVYDSNIHVKPFLTPVPEVKIFDLGEKVIKEDDVLIMACDGLWDVTSNDEARFLARSVLSDYDYSDKMRYINAAQRLVLNARGLQKGRAWKTELDKPASGDDVCAFVIPLHFYKQNIIKNQNQTEQRLFENLEQKNILSRSNPS